MASAKRTTKTAKANTVPQNNPLTLLKDHVYTMAAAFAGVVFGVLASLGFVSSYLSSQFATETANLNHAIVSMQSTADTSACVAPSNSGGGSGGGSKPAVITADSTTPGNSTPPAGGGMGGGGGTPPPFVEQLINGTISDTGPGSTNTITASNTNTTTVTNTNNVGVSNVNVQGASSGSAHASDNSSGGSATSGNATNSNSSSTTVSIAN